MPMRRNHSVNRIFMLTSTYCIVVLPYVYQGIRNNLNGMNASRLIEAAQMLGAGRFYAFFHIVVPNIISGVMVVGHAGDGDCVR